MTKYMTSYIRGHTFSNDKQLQYVRVTGPYYTDPQVGSTLLPLQYGNGMLEIADVDGARSYSGPPLMDAEISLYNLYLYKIMGGDSLVTELGPNFINYVKRWRSTVTVAPVTSVSLVIPGIVTKIQRARKDALYTGSVFAVSTAPQLSDNYIDGSDENFYRTTWIFKRPLTVKTVEDGIIKYIVFNTTLY